ncbi:MAG TPA: hypothetical protein VJV23_06290, partial [Candidatus Polarisedimenticolia bacterium]|nr:hypothetical protein [Candidatus Polarisedimenticolia bacterium]
WMAEILRKDHRTCSRCRMAPTHVYDPDPDEPLEGIRPESRSGTPLCNACLGARLAEDLAQFAGRCLVFEPAQGPDLYVFRPVEGRGAAWPKAQAAAARSALQRLPAGCSECGRPGRFLWVPVPEDADYWSADWPAALASGDLSPEAPLCGEHAAARLVSSLEARGLFFEAVFPPRAGDGALFAAEA